MADHSGESLNQLFEVLMDWNTYLKDECPEIYSRVCMIET
jgi:hypothetical protein